MSLSLDSAKIQYSLSWPMIKECHSSYPPSSSAKLRRNQMCNFRIYFSNGVSCDPNTIRNIAARFIMETYLRPVTVPVIPVGWSKLNKLKSKLQLLESDIAGFLEVERQLETITDQVSWQMKVRTTPSALASQLRSAGGQSMNEC
jgi:hypothetical protein